MNSKPSSMLDQTLVESPARAKSVVLHVDDDMASLIMAEGPLLDAGFQVVQASDGIQAIEQFEKHTPDLIIMDAVMPNMDGFEAITRIRKTVQGAHVPILMTTGLDDLESITKAYDKGATDFLPKPINFFIMPYRVQYMLRSKTTADELRSSQARLDNAQRIARLGHWEWDVATNHTTWSREVTRMFGFNQSVLGGSWESLLAKVGADERAEVRVQAELAVESGVSFSLEFKVAGFRENDLCSVRLEAEPGFDNNGVCTHMQGTVQDITEAATAQKEIHDLAYYDLVTGLPNRAQLRESLTQTLRMSERTNSEFALLFLDLDHFKQVNDTLGHDAGDDLLQQVSNRLSSVLRDSDVLGKPERLDEIDVDELGVKDTVARIGGDEFVVLLSNINRAEDAARVAERIGQSVSEPYTISGIDVAVTTTIGISVYPADGGDAETLMKHADVAMYHAKENGRNGFQFYSRSIHDQALTRFSLERELKVAIEDAQLKLEYQPKLDMRTGEVVGVEALVRWSHPEKGSISPSEFIPMAEETGLIVPLGKWVLDESARQIQDWIKRGVGTYSVAVNCSPVQFTRGNMISDIADTIRTTGVDPALLEVELTENLFLHNIENGIQLLSSIKELGVQIAVDDFGTGFSSLSYLKRLPVDKLKIDQSFVENLHTDKGDAAIASAIVILGHNLGLTVIAEGVENEQQLEILRRYKCNEAQGYYFCKPLSRIDFEQWIVDRAGPYVKTGTG